jgi:hypothetical protein
MTRLQTMCRVFNWQGGTVHQVHAELKKYKFNLDIHKISQDSFEVLVHILSLRINEAKIKEIA